MQINPSSVRYIKLGEGGTWEQESIEHGQVLRLDYRKVPHDLCIQSAWGEVLDVLREQRKDAGAATRDLTQIRLFYEALSDVLWVTFFGDRMYWCFSKPEITLLSDGSKTRPVIDCWRSTNTHGAPLHVSELSGKLLRVQRFGGTICSVKEVEYTVQKINGRTPPEVEAARTALAELERTLETIIRRLHWKDFEVLTDLIFRQAG